MERDHRRIMRKIQSRRKNSKKQKQRLHQDKKKGDRRRYSVLEYQRFRDLEDMNLTKPHYFSDFMGGIEASHHLGLNRYLGRVLLKSRSEKSPFEFMVSINPYFLIMLLEY